MNNSYKYESKYSKLSAEEILEKKKEKQLEWKAKLSEDANERLRERQREANKINNKHRDMSGVCEKCGGREYKDIYQHKKSKKHQKNIGLVREE